MLILAIAHTTKRNAYIIALFLPLFSFLISSHPVFLKMLLISAELVLNVYMFFAIFKRISKLFVCMFLSIIISKVFYYAFKFGLICLVLLDTNLISTPLYIQLITSVIFSGYIYLVYKKTN
ncbi:MAG: hypothetical protein K8R58_14020 [Bacteroidales bacterium]|nr:hypothetical protein [Bacteroidales bacterium]